MALKIGKNDVFERNYMNEFRCIASKFGEFVEYQRDRAGRDIGLHFVEQKLNGSEIVSPALVWFQMKGVQSSTFSKKDFEDTDDLSISLEVNHLRFWYIAPEPTYLALYIESVNCFFVLNIQKYITEKFGDEILTLNQKSQTVYINKHNVLDEQAFYLIKQKQSIVAWQNKIEEGKDFAHIFFRDAELINRLAIAERQNISIKFVLKKYGAKTRSEGYFFDSDKEIRGHLEYMMPDKLELTFPYLDFNPEEGKDYDEDLYCDEDDTEWPPLILPNGKKVLPEGVFEMVDYSMVVSLNSIGKAWAQTLEVMILTDFIELDPTGTTMVSVAPWHGRGV
jgi:hypothetical protein